MDKEIDTHIYFPSDTEKVMIEGFCSEIIGILHPLSVPQKAFLLKSLIDSFEDVSGIKVTAIIDDNSFCQIDKAKKDESNGGKK